MDERMIGRRGFLRGAGALLAAPAIVRAASLMPVSVAPVPIEAYWSVSHAGLLSPALIQREALAILENNLVGVRRVNRLFAEAWHRAS